MPFDLERASQRIRACHDDLSAFRAVSLDLLFATASAVSEAAVALEAGDALAIRASGPAAPSMQPPRVIVAIDLEPPHLSSVRSALGPARWPAALASLGGPEVAIAWVAALRSLAGSASQRPWRALYVRGPAAGLASFVAAELADLEADAEIIQIVPSIQEALAADHADPPGAELGLPALATGGAMDLLTLDLLRPRNVWRFPACDSTYALTGSHSWRESFPALRGLLASLDSDVAWTLHDLHFYFGSKAHFSAVLRTARPVDVTAHGFTTREVDAGSRLMFPVNDALATLTSLGSRVGASWAGALAHPVHLHALPDGLHAAIVVPADETPKLPEKLGSMALQWARYPMIAASTERTTALAVGPSERPGPVAAGVDSAQAQVWQVPARLDHDVHGLARAIDAQLAADAGR